MKMLVPMTIVRDVADCIRDYWVLVYLQEWTTKSHSATGRSQRKIPYRKELVLEHVLETQQCEQCKTIYKRSAVEGFREAKVCNPAHKRRHRTLYGLRLRLFAPATTGAFPKTVAKN